MCPARAVVLWMCFLSFDPFVGDDAVSSTRWLALRPFTSGKVHGTGADTSADGYEFSGMISSVKTDLIDLFSWPEKVSRGTHLGVNGRSRR